MSSGKVNATLSKSEFEWEIINLQMCSRRVGEFLESPKFVTYSACGKTHWHLRLYPKGRVDNDDRVSLFLIHAGDESKVSANFKILNNKGEVAVSQDMPETVFDKQYWGRGIYVSRSFVMNPANGILNNDKMTIACEIGMVPYEAKEVKLDKEVEESEVDVLPATKVIDKYEALLNDSIFSDVSLISESKAVNAHKCILAKSSPVFAAMFEADMKEKQENIVEIVDIRYDVLVEMVRFVYAGKVKKMKTLAGELAVAADKYALDELKDMCRKTITENLSIDNVFDCLQLAAKLRMHDLEQTAVEFIVEKGSDATDKPEFESLPADIMCRVSRTFANKRK